MYSTDKRISLITYNRSCVASIDTTHIFVISTGLVKLGNEIVDVISKRL